MIRIFRVMILSAALSLGSLFMLVLVMNTGALAADWKFTPTLSVKEEYNDNLFLDEDNTNEKKDDFITTLSPGLELSRSSERFQLGFSGKLDRRIYHAEDKLNDTDQQYMGNARYIMTPRLSLSGRAEYKKDSSPDRDIETTGLVLNSTTRKRNRFGVSGDYTISEMMTGTLSYDYSKDRYDSEDNSDLDSHGVNLVLIRDVGSLIPAAMGRAILGYTNYIFEDSKVDNYEMMVGFSKSFSETWNLLVDVGGRYTRSRFDVQELVFIPPFLTTVKKEKETDGWGVVGQTVLSWKGEKASFDFTLSQDIMPASGRGGTSNRTSLGWRTTRKFTYELSGSLSGGYFRNKSSKEQYSSEEIDEETFHVSTGLKYDFTRDLSLDASYTYTRTNYNVTDTDADRNLFMVRFNLKYPILE